MRLFLIFSILLILLNCSQQSKGNYVESKRTILENFHSKHSHQTDSIFLRYEWIESNPYLKIKCEIIDSLDDLEEKLSKLIASISVESSEPELNINDINTSNTIFFNNISNIMFPGIGKQLDGKKLTTPYIISSLDYQLLNGTDYYSRESIPLFWSHYNDNQYFEDWKDSVWQEKIYEIETEELEEMGTFKKAKYGIMINDVIISYPTLISDSLFETGNLISIVQLLDLESKNILQKSIILTNNSDKVSYLSLPTFEELDRINIDSELIQDFNRQKLNQLIQLYNIKN